MQVLKFAHPVYLHALWGVLVLIGFFIVIFKRKEALLRRFGHLEILKKMMPGYMPSRAVWRAVLFILGYIFMVVALADPQIGTRLEDVKREGVDIIVALDVSMSMKAEDIAPNRLEKAKHEISRLIDILQGDRIGLVAFAGIAHVQCPLTLDYAAAKLFLRMMDSDLIPQPGTAIGEAIETSIKAFNQKERKYKILILITDGEDHESEPVEAAEKAAQEGILIYTIGLGSAQGVPIPMYDGYGNQSGFKKDREGNVVTTKLDVTTLQKIAYTTNGKYYISTSGETELEEIYDDVNKMEKKELTSRQFSQYEDRFQIFIAVSLLLFLAETILPVRRKTYQYEVIEVPGITMIRFLFILFLLSVLCSSVFPQGIRGKVNAGNDRFHEEKYDEALTNYQDALLDDPLNDKVIFNQGDALYKMEKYDEAVEAYQKVLGSEDIPLTAKVYYNIGNSYFQQNKLQESIEAYKKSLELIPDDYEAKYNLELARAKLKEMADKQSQQQQNQQQQQQQQGQQDQQNSEQGENKEDQEEQQQEQEQQQQQQAAEEEQKDEKENKSEQNQDEQEKLDRQEAERILNALQDDELEAQENKPPVKGGRRTVGKDW